MGLGLSSPCIRLAQIRRYKKDSYSSMVALRPYHEPSGRQHYGRWFRLPYCGFYYISDAMPRWSHALFTIHKIIQSADYSPYFIRIFRSFSWREGSYYGRLRAINNHPVFLLYPSYPYAPRWTLLHFVRPTLFTSGLLFWRRQGNLSSNHMLLNAGDGFPEEPKWSSSATLHLESCSLFNTTQ